MVSNQYSSYSLVDSAVGNRLLLAFLVSPPRLERRLRSPWQIAPSPTFTKLGIAEEQQPNLVLVFHHLLLDQDAQGRNRLDSGLRFVVFVIPVANPETGEQGMMHFRMFTGGAIPGRYRDALPAQVRHEYQLVEESTGRYIREGYQVHPEAGGSIECRVTYEQGLLLRQMADRPNYPLWSAADASIVRVYQEDSVLGILRNDTAGLNVTRDVLFRSTVPELVDLFDDSERLVGIFGNTYYARKVFSPEREER